MKRRAFFTSLLGLSVPALAQEKDRPIYYVYSPPEREPFPNGHCPLCGTKAEYLTCLSDAFDNAHLGITREHCPIMESFTRAVVTCSKCKNVYEFDKREPKKE